MLIKFSLIYLVTLFFSLGVQYLFYLFYKLNNDSIIKNHKTFFNYISGVVGDGLILPIINIFCWVLIKESQLVINNQILINSILGGVLITYIFHLIQLKFKLINWTMPTLNNWTLLGLYHAVFMMVECSFLTLTLISYINSDSVFYPNVFRTGNYIFLFLGIFLLSMLIDHARPLIKKSLAPVIRPVQPVIRYALAVIER